MPPEKLKFFDEAGVHTGTGNPVYGNSLRGEAAVEVISGNKKGANVTLNLLCGLEGVLYANTVEGASDSTIFLISLPKLAKSQLHSEIPPLNLAIISYLTTAPHIDTRLGTFCKDGYWEHKSFILHPFHQNSTLQNTFSIK